MLFSYPGLDIALKKRIVARYRGQVSWGSRRVQLTCSSMSNRNDLHNARLHNTHTYSPFFGLRLSGPPATRPPHGARCATWPLPAGAFIPFASATTAQLLPHMPRYVCLRLVYILYVGTRYHIAQPQQLTSAQLPFRNQNHIVDRDRHTRLLTPPHPAPSSHTH